MIMAVEVMLKNRNYFMANGDKINSEAFFPLMLEVVVVVATIITRLNNKSCKVCIKQCTYIIKLSQFSEAGTTVIPF